MIEGVQAKTVLADPPWRFSNRTSRVAPECPRLNHYETMELSEICALPVATIAEKHAHLYLWVPCSLIGSGLEVMKAWGFDYKTMLVWHKVRRDGGTRRDGCGWYFRTAAELLLFGVRGRARTLAPGRHTASVVSAERLGHSRKPDAFYELIEACSPGPFVELFARRPRDGWHSWGDQLEVEASA